MHDTWLDLLIQGLAFAMAILEFLLRCFRRRSPASEQRRRLCTDEDSVQDGTTNESQLITSVNSEKPEQEQIKSSADAAASLAFHASQPASPPEDVSIDSTFGFAGILVQDSAAQV